MIISAFCLSLIMEIINFEQNRKKYPAFYLVYNLFFIFERLSNYKL
jgi:hypothetical protein